MIRSISLKTKPCYTESIVFSPGGKTCLTAVYWYEEGALSGQHIAKAEVLEWNVNGGDLKGVWKALDGALASIALSPDDKILAMAFRGPPGFMIWDAKTGDLIRDLSHGSFGLPYSLSFAPDGWRLASCYGPRPGGVPEKTEATWNVNIWNVQTGYVGLLSTGHQEPLTAVAYSPDGKHLATGDSGRYSKRNLHEGAVVRMYGFP